jgi:hypothetical protein
MKTGFANGNFFLYPGRFYAHQCPGTGPHSSRPPAPAPDLTSLHPSAVAPDLIKPYSPVSGPGLGPQKHEEIFTRMLNDRNQDIQPSHLSH